MNRLKFLFTFLSLSLIHRLPYHKYAAVRCKIIFRSHPKSPTTFEGSLISGGRVNWRHKQIQSRIKFCHSSIRSQLSWTLQRRIFTTCMQFAIQVLKIIIRRIQAWLFIQLCRRFTRNIQTRRRECGQVSIPRWNCQNFSAGSRKIRIRRVNKFKPTLFNWTHWIRDAAENHSTSTTSFIGSKTHVPLKNVQKRAGTI